MVYNTSSYVRHKKIPCMPTIMPTNPVHVATETLNIFYTNMCKTRHPICANRTISTSWEYWDIKLTYEMLQTKTSHLWKMSYTIIFLVWRYERPVKQIWLCRFSRVSWSWTRVLINTHETYQLNISPFLQNFIVTYHLLLILLDLKELPCT